MVIASGPASRELPLFLIACESISGEKRDIKLSSGHSLRNFRLTIRADGSLVWETAEVNCSAKSVAIYIHTLRVRDLEEKMMSWLGGVSFCFPIWDFIMFHRREGFHLCEHDSTVWV